MCDHAPAPAAPAELWTVKQAAEYLGVHRGFIDRRLADGTLTAYKLGHIVRLDADQVRGMLTIAPPSGVRR